MSLKRNASGNMGEWERIFAQSRVVPLHRQRSKHARSESTGYQIFLGTLEGTLIKQKDSEGFSDVNYQIRLSLFDVTYHHFFGRTWRSTSKPCKATSGQTPKVIFNEPVYILAAPNDPNIVAVVEVVAITKKRDGATQELSCGFGIMTLFSSQPEEDPDDQTRRLKLYYGTPRSLLHPSFKDPTELSRHMTLMENSHIQYTVRLHGALQGAAHLLPLNVLVSGSESVPGLVSARDGSGNELKKPHLQRTIVCHLDKLSLFLYPSLEKFEEELIGLINNDRLPKNPRADGATVSIQERRLHIGVHNGWGFVQKPQVVVLVPESEVVGNRSTMSLKKKASSQQKSSSAVQALVLRSRIRLPEMVNHPGFAVVFQLEYVFSVPSGVSGKVPSVTCPLNTSYMHMIRWASFNPRLEPGSSEVTLSLQGGPQANPSNALVYKIPPTSMSSDEVQQVEAGTIQFEFYVRSETRFEDGAESVDGFREELTQSNKKTASFNPKVVVQSRVSLQESQLGPALSMSQLTASPRYPTISHSSKLALQQVPSQLMPSPMAYQRSHAEFPYVSGITHLEADMSETNPDLSASDHLQELLFSPVHAPIVAMGTQTGSSTSLLSRAALARLHSVDFPEILDCNNEVAEVVDPSDPVNFNPQREEADHLQCNEIILQFLACSRLREDDASAQWPRTIYFTFQFYRFQPVTTPRLQLVKLHPSSTDPLAHILLQINQDGSINKGSPGYQLKYMVDPGYLKPGEQRWFRRYLALQTLQIDVWDGESLLLIGSAAVEMKHLLRQGRPAVQVSHELEVITTEYEQDMVMTGDLTKQGTAKPIGVHTIIKGRLHLRMGNVGRLSEQKLKRSESLPPSKSRIISTHDGRSGFRGGSLLPNNALGGKNISQAQKLADLDSELAAMLFSRMKELSIAYQNPSSETDATQRRKIERMMAVRQLESQENVNSRKALILTRHEERTQHSRDLQIIEAYRERTKADCISSMLNQAITSNYTVYATLGAAEFFEFQLKNPYNTQHTVTIEIDNTDLRVIVDTKEWKYFKGLTNTSTPLEENMFHTEQNFTNPRLFLRPKETVYVPFRYQAFCVHHVTAAQPGPGVGGLQRESQRTSQYDPNAMSSRKIKVSFKTSDGKPVAILQVNVEPQPHVIDQTFRFYHPELTFLKKSIRLPPWYTLPGAPVGMSGGEPEFHVHCSDPNVICDTKKMGPGEPQDIFIKVAGGPSPQIKKFFVVLYIDPWFAAPLQIWQIYVHSLKRVDVSCVTGQPTRLSLVLRGTQVIRKVKAYSSHPKELKVDPDGVFVLPPNGIQDLHISVCPSKAGSKFTYLNLVDVDQHQLVASWLVCVSCRNPIISKAFEIALTAGGEKGCNKRITYTNPYQTKKVYSLRTNRPDLLQFKENTFQVGVGETYTIGLRFAPSQSSGLEEILIFINDQEDKNEETFCVKVKYEPPVKLSS
ncbi:nephrocystin-4 [Spea bombifrons]|uniref:nephrocystin-4 n=1 Tax=Spea bombifrons TaxID=233779 RepID=UPI00234988CE|nr:nephrocystin-4 [Spea bombifrons]